MMASKKLVLVALAIPVLALLGLTAYKHYRMTAGTELVLPIRGYDPRDLLSGHYLTYRVDYGINDICRGSRHRANTGRWLCLDTKRASDYPPAGCDMVIKGVCDGSRFRAGIERFYIPQDDAVRLDRLVRGGEASIRISVSGDGTAQLQDLLIDGKPWKELEPELK